MDDVLTSKEAARRLGYSLDHLYRLLKAETIKGRRWGREWMIPRSEIERVRALQDDHGRLR